MVDKGAVLQWFQRLVPHERLELMCRMLYLCCPLELRFLACCAEDLSRRELPPLREWETRANTLTELLWLVDLLHEVARCRVTVALALLHATNARCADVLHRVLVINYPLLKHISAQSTCLLQHVCLMYTMAMYHPAFGFDKKLQLVPMHQHFVDRLRNSATDSSCSCELCAEPQDGSSEERRSAEAGVTSPACSADAVQAARSAPAWVKSVSASAVAQLPDSLKSDSPLRISVLHSTGTRTDITRSLGDLIRFCQRVSSTHATALPEALKQLADSRRQQESHAAYAPDAVRQLLRCITELPQQVRSSPEVVDFFSCRRPPRHGRDTPTRPASSASIAGRAHPPPAGGAQKHSPATAHSRTHSDSALRTAPPNSRTESDSGLRTAPLHSRTESDSGLHTAARSTAAAAAAAAAALRRTGSGVSLPLQSLRSNSHDRVCARLEYTTKLQSWLKVHRMHKYLERLRKYSFQELLALNREKLEAEQFTQGAIRKLLGMLEQVRMDRAAFEQPSRSSGSPTSSGTCSEDEQQLQVRQQHRQRDAGRQGGSCSSCGSRQGGSCSSCGSRQGGSCSSCGSLQLAQQRQASRRFLPTRRSISSDGSQC